MGDKPQLERTVHVGILAANPIVERGLVAMLNDSDDFEASAVAGELEIHDRTPYEVLVAFIDDANDPALSPDELAPNIPCVLLLEQGVEFVPSFGIQPLALLSCDADVPTLSAAIHAVNAGLSLVDGTLASSLQLSYRASEFRATPDTDPISPREVQVLELVSNGLPNKAIAVALGISEHTVKFHVGSILDKLDADSRTEAVMIATRLGILRI